MNSSLALQYPICMMGTNANEIKPGHVQRTEKNTDDFASFFHCSSHAVSKHEKFLLSDIETCSESILRSEGEALEAQCEKVLLAVRNSCCNSVFIAKNILAALIVSIYKKGSASGLELDKIDLCEHFRVVEQCQNIFQVKTILFNYVRSIREVKRDGQYSCLVKNVIKCIEEHYAEEMNMKRVADQFKISPSYLCSILHKETGETFIKILTKTRLREAKRMLRDPTMRVGEISEAVGYGDYVYFYKLFKKNESCSPIAYRNSHVSGS